MEIKLYRSTVEVYCIMDFCRLIIPIILLHPDNNVAGTYLRIP